MFGWAESKPGFHPEMVPSSVTKMNSAGIPGARVKSALPLNTCPVGVDVEVDPLGGGMTTTRGLTVAANVLVVPAML